jgi:hypothetical protein
MRLGGVLLLLLLLAPLAAFAQALQIAPIPSGISQSDIPEQGPKPLNTTVTLIQVEATGKTQEEAKAKAIRAGARDAFEQLMNRISPEDTDRLLAKLTPEQIEAMVQNRDVLDEKFDGTHYEGLLNYRFDAHKIARLPRKNKPASAPAAADAQASGALPGVAANAHAILLVPVLQTNEISQLWEDSNSWRKSWNHIALQVGRGELIVPYGDRRDREEVGPHEALTGTFKDFADMADRYGVQEVYVAIAEYDSPDLAQGVQVRLRKLSANDLSSEMLRYPAQMRETRDQQLERVAMELARRLTRLTGAVPENYVPAQDNVVTIRLAYKGMKQYLKLLHMLKAIPFMHRVMPESISYYESTVTLYYRTSPEMLGKSFAASGFRIYKDGESMILALPE